MHLPRGIRQPSGEATLHGGTHVEEAEGHTRKPASPQATASSTGVIGMAQLGNGLLHQPGPIVLGPGLSHVAELPRSEGLELHSDEEGWDGHGHGGRGACVACTLKVGGDGEVAQRGIVIIEVNSHALIAIHSLGEFVVLEALVPMACLLRGAVVPNGQHLHSISMAVCKPQIIG